MAESRITRSRAEQIPGGVEWNGDGSGMIHCPYHDDKKPSCSIDIEKEVFNCFGCDAKGTLRELFGHCGIEYDGKYQLTNQEQTPYDYRDLNGELLYQNVRYYKKTGEKGFYARRPKPGGGWINSIKGVERVLYHLLDTMFAIEAHKTIYVVEGEKDADNLIRLGYAATCNEGGAKNWKKAHAQWLKNADIVIIGDRDKAGQSWVRAVARSLKDLAASVKTIDLPYPITADNGRDISDWLSEHSADDLPDLLEKSEKYDFESDKLSESTETDSKAEKSTDLTDFSDRWTDLANAVRFSDFAKGKVLYCDPHSRWYYYDGRRWAEDRVNYVDGMAKQLIRLLYAEGSTIIDDKERQAFIKGALSLEGRGRLRNFIELSRSDLAIVPENFNADPLLLNVNNGVVNLKTGELQGHAPELLLSKISEVEYDPAAECPQWLDHLALCFNGDLDIVSYFQRLVGYTLSAETGEHAFIFAYGPPSTGKSTTLNVIEKLLGEYAVRTAIETFLLQKFSDHPASVYALSGARMILAQEPGKGRRWNEARINELTGEPRISARKMRGDPENIPVTGKIWISANYKPRVDDPSGAFWRRIRLLPFDYKIPPEDKILDFDKLLWAEESSGILNWALRGFQLWREQGLEPTPQKVTRAIAGYRDDEDVLTEFFEEYVDRIPGATIGAQELFNAYRDYCEENGLKAFSKQKFPREMEDRGYTRIRTMKGWEWQNLALKS